MEWGVYKWIMRRARGHETCARSDRLTRPMWQEGVAWWGITNKAKRCGVGERRVQEKVLDRGERKKARPGILLCAPLGLKPPRGNIQSMSGQWYNVHADIFWRDNIPGGLERGDQCWRCTKEAGQVPWPVLRMTAWVFLTATMRTTNVRGQWWGPVLLPREVHEEEGAHGDMEIWCGEEHEGNRAGVQIGRNTVRGLREEDDGVAVSLPMTDTGRPAEEAPLVLVNDTCEESAPRIRLTVHRLPADRVWYLVLVQAILEQGRAKGNRAWWHGVLVTNGWKARTEKKCAVYRGVKEISIDASMRTYDIGLHKVYYHHLREAVRIPEPEDGSVMVFLDGSGVEGQPPRAGAAEVQVKKVGQKTEVILTKVRYGAASHGEVQTVADVVGGLGEDVTEMWMVVGAEPDMASLRRLATKRLHEALGTGLASQVYTIWHRLEMRSVPLVVYLVKQESHRASVGNHEADTASQAVDKELEPEWRVPERKEHLHI